MWWDFTVGQGDRHGSALDHQALRLRDHQGILPMAVEGVAQPIEGYEVGIAEHHGWTGPSNTHPQQS